MHLKKLQLQGFKTFAERTEILFSEGVTAVVGPNGSGKCVTGDTLVTLADGRDVPIRELVDRALATATVQVLDDGWLTQDNPDRLHVLSLDPETLRLEPRPIAGFVKRTAPDHLLRVRTRSGREVTATPYHPLFTLRGGRLAALKAEELRVGVRIAVPRHLPTRSPVSPQRLQDPVPLFGQDDSVFVPPSPALRAWADTGRAKFGTWTAWRHEADVPATQFTGLLNGQGVNTATLTRLARAADTPAPFAGVLKSRTTGHLRVPSMMTPDLARFLGLLIAEGRNNVGGLIWFVNSDAAVNAEYARLAQSLFGLSACSRNYKVSAVDNLLFSKTLGQVLERVFGLKVGSRSADKEFPPQMLQAGPDTAWAFLSGLFEGDAHLCHRTAEGAKGTTAYVEYATASRRLAEQITALLLRLGIFATIRPKRKWATNSAKRQMRTYYSVFIYGTEQVRRAARHLRFVGDKERTRCALASLECAANPNHDLIPGAAALVKDAARLAGVSVKRVRRGRARLAAYVEGRCEPSRGGLREVTAQIRELGARPEAAQALLAGLDTLAQSDVYWDEVVAIEQVAPPDEWVYDLSVAGTHNFVAGNVVVHNSNLGDAVLWVLGEQKASAVRGSKASDVIFAGSDRRKPLGMAEVSLTVDNSDGTLPVEFAEVTVTRRAYRTGEGEYLINKVPCRLKDIYELFLDTGVGREAYSLVNQSEIDAVLSVNPEDRRGLFEEAAGIKKYRVRKREALRKLDATEANVLRVRDILHEIEGRLGPLRAQAERARRFVEIRDRLRAIESDLLIVDLRFADYELTAARQAREEEQAAVAKHAARIAAAEARALGIAQRLADAEATLEACRLQHGAALAQAERAEGERALAAQRVESLAAARRALNAELEDLADRRTRLAAQVAETERELGAVRAQEADLRRGAAERQAAVQGVGDEIAALNRRGERRRQEARELARRQAARQADAARAEARVAELEAGLPALRDEIARGAASSGERAASLTNAQEAVDAARRAAAAAERALADASAARDAARSAAQAAQARAHAAQSECVALSTRLRGLQDLEDAQEGYFAGVRAVFEAVKRGSLRGDFTVVADAFQTPPGYETALETALAASLQDIITATEGEAKAAIAFLHDSRAGRATFLPLDRMRPARDTLDLGRASGLGGVRGAALEIVTFDPRFRPALDVLLGRVFVCETLDDALRASTAARGWNRVVTLSGEIVLPSGALTGGRQGGDRGRATLLGRKTEIASLQGRLAEAGRAQERARQALADADAARERADGAVQAAQAARSEAAGAGSEATRRLAFAEAEARRGEDAAAQAQRRLDATQAALAQAREAAGAAGDALLSGDALTADADDALAEETLVLGGLTAAREAAQGDLTAARVALATVSEKAASLERSLRAARADADQVAGAEARKDRQAHDAGAEHDALAARTDAREAEAARAVQARDAARRALDAQGAARQELLQESYQANAEMRGLAEARAGALEAIHRHELREARLGAQRDQLAARLADEYEVRLEDALALPEDPEVTEGAPQEVARLRRELRALGEVNTGALQDWEETRQRHEFLTAQRADLDEARAKLLEAIRDIDASTRGVFLETFRAVSAAFQEIFARLFNGGQTELRLTDPDDILETGVDIHVQPPGKKRQPLALLSGGERALTAAALLFAFLKVKPSPFCVMDEVDAPLDGANVERFADLLRDFGARSQFIVITHNPVTMEAAPLWYGVTMPEPGISRVLSMHAPAADGER